MAHSKVAHVKSRHGSWILGIFKKINKKIKQMEELKTILGGLYDVAVSLGEMMGNKLNDVIDELIPQSEEQTNKKGGGKWALILL